MQTTDRIIQSIISVFLIVGVWVFVFPILIGVSCLFTEQHYFIDLPAGALPGLSAFGLFRMIH
jgi:hypothetical protein